MTKLKPAWMKTNIPKDTKIKLWRIMMDCPTYSTWDKDIDSHAELFDKAEYDWLPRSRATYKALQNEIMEIPIQEVHSLPSDLQMWIQELRPELRIISLADALREITLTASEVDIFKRTYVDRLLRNPDFGVTHMERFTLPIYHRIKRLEARHNPLKEGDAHLLLAAIDLDDHGFDWLVDEIDWRVSTVLFGAEGDPTVVNTLCAATKLLLGIPEQQVLQEEIDKEKNLAQETKRKKLYSEEQPQKAVMAAQNRVQWAKGLALLQYPYLIRGFAKELTNQAPPKPSSEWVRVN